MKGSDVATFLQAPLEGNDYSVSGVSALEDAQEGSLVFIKASSVPTTVVLPPLLTLIAPLDFAGTGPGLSIIRVVDPRNSFARVAATFFAPSFWDAGVDPSSIVDQAAVVADSASVGPFCYIGPNSSLGERTVLASHVSIGPNVQIGDDCHIGPHSSIGHSGFGIETDENGLPFRIPHIGGVSIGNNVELGALNTVAQGTLRPTIICNQVKTDDHVHIAHNVRIGERTLVTACAEISGSVDVGSDVWLAPNSALMNGISIGAGGVVGLGAVVIRDVLEGQTVLGNPARPLRTRPRHE